MRTFETKWVDDKTVQEKSFQVVFDSMIAMIFNK